MNMKKKYINPEMEIIAAEVEQMIATSYSAAISDETQDNGDALSPIFNFE